MANTILKITNPYSQENSQSYVSDTTYPGVYTREMQEARAWEERLNNDMRKTPDYAAPLRPLVAFFIATLKPARIYITCHDIPREEPHFTVSVVLSSSAPAPDTFRHILDIAYLQHHHVYCALYNEGRLIADLQNSSLYALINFTDKQIVYNNSIAHYPLIETQQLLQAKQKAQDIFIAHFKKAKAFLQLAQTPIIPQDKELTLFLLHQAMELTCRALLLSLGGYNVKEHAIQLLFKHLRRHVPHLLEIFDADKDKQLLNILEQSYTASRYEASFKVKPEVIPKLVTKVIIFQDFAEACVRRKTA